MGRYGLILFLFLFGQTTLTASDYYIDSRTGSDQNNGLSPETAWRTIARSTKGPIKAGDRVLFARGGLWREILKPVSGEEGQPVYYGAYGSGPLPKLYGSVDGSNPEYWIEIKPGIWCSKKIKPEPVGDFSKEGIDRIAWSMYKEKEVNAHFTKTPNGFKVNCTKGKNTRNSIQIWGTVGDSVFSNGLLITFRARCSQKFELPAVTMIRGSAPYTSLYSDSGSYSLEQNWKTFYAFLIRNESTEEIRPEDFRYHLSLGTLPADSSFEFELLSLQSAKIDLAHLLRADVGNIIFDHGKFTKYHRCGIKKWSLQDLKEPGQYWYDPSEKQVYLCWKGNPARECQSIELALRESIVNEGGAHDVTFENLAVAYGAAHGFGGGSTRNITIRNCDIYYIGGGHQHTRDNGVPVRFGNAIEFWGSCDGNLVEKNRIWEIYDAALTNQGNGTSPRNTSRQTNIIYRDNLIWNSEYSFEYWNRGEFAVSNHILFENNICWNAGFGWAHGQRPDPIGCHCMFSSNTAPSEDIVVRNNIFDEATECSICFRGTTTRPWQDFLTLDKNQYYQSKSPLIKWFNKGFFQKDELDRIRRELKFEINGKFEKYSASAPAL